MNTWLKIAFLRCRSLFRSNKVEGELNKEIQFHIDMLIQEKVESGLTPDTARSEALADFGYVDFVKEECRDNWGTRIVFNLWRDFKFGIRQLSKSKGFTFIAIATLALGIGANTSMFSLLNTLFLRPPPFPQSGDLVRIYRVSPNDDRGSFSAADYLEISQHASELGEIAAYTHASVNLSEPGLATEIVQELKVSSNFLQTLRVTPLLGRTFREKDSNFGAARSLMISHSFWQSRFAADPNILGRELRLNGETHQIVGVLPNTFYDRRYLGQIKVFRPFEISTEDHENLDNHWINLVGRLGNKVSPTYANSFIANLGQQRVSADPHTNENTSWRTEQIQDTFMNPTGRAIVTILVALSGFVLLIACGNLANVLLARTIARSREFAMRAAIGATRFDLMRPLVVESLILAVAGGGCALIVSVWFGKWLTAMSAKGGGDGIVLPIDWRVLVFAAGVSFIASLAFAIAPALFATRIDINKTLGGNVRGSTVSRSSQKLRGSLIVAQFALALILLAGSGFFISGGRAMFARNYGWNADNVIIGYFELPSDRYPSSDHITEFHRRAAESIEALPGVQSISLSHALPFVGAGGSQRKFRVEGQEALPRGEEPNARVIGSSPDYFETIGTPLLSGRLFNRHDTIETPKVAIITLATAQGLFGEDSPLGRRLIRLGEGSHDPLEIVGVVGNIEPIGLSVERGPTDYQVYKPLAQELWHSANIAVRIEGLDPESLIPTINSVFTEIDPNLPIRDLSSAINRIRTVNSDVYLIGTLLSVFAILGLALSSLGIYGVIARSVAQRTGEFGIRMALGAKDSDIVRNVLKSGIRLSLTGATIGLLGSFALAKILSAGLPTMQTSSWIVITSMTLTLVTIATIASYLPARKATKISPSEALLADS